MKTVLKVTAVVALMLSTVVSSAKERLDVVALNKAKSLLLVIQDSSQDLAVRLVDSDFNTIYSETIKSSNINKKFDLKNLNDGTYYFYTSNDLRDIAYTISISDNVLSIVSEEEKVKPFFRKTEDKILMNFLNSEKSSVEIKLYDEDNRLVFSEIRNEEVIVEKAFDFSKAFPGVYTVIISDENNSYTESFIVD